MGSVPLPTAFRRLASPRLATIASTIVAAVVLSQSASAVGNAAAGPTRTHVLPWATASRSSRATTTGSATGGPALTVVGFGLVSLPVESSTQTQASERPQIGISFSVESASPVKALDALTTALKGLQTKAQRAGVPQSDISEQGAPNLNYNGNSGNFTASAGLQIDLPSLNAVAAVMTKLPLTSNPDINNVYVNNTSPNVSAPPTASAVSAGYAQAFAEALSTARLMAASNHLRLGAELSVREGAPSQQECSAMGGCNGVLAPGLVQIPMVSPNQQAVAVTVTFATAPEAGAGAA